MIAVSFTFHGSFASKGNAHKDQRETGIDRKQTRFYYTISLFKNRYYYQIFWCPMADLPEKLWVNTECSNHHHSEWGGSHLLKKQNQTQVTCVSQENNPSLAAHKKNRKHVESQVLKGNVNRRRKKCQRCWNKHWTSSCLDVFVAFWFFSSYLKNP